MTRESEVQQMLRTIESECRYTSGLTGVKKIQQKVMVAMGEVLREKFVSGNMKLFAYDNGPLPIGNGQTISQPYIVALMTDLLLPEENDVILEVGAGSGYQAAILSKLVQQVYSIEIIPALAKQAQARLAILGLRNIEVQEGDGYYGLPEHAPFDGIIVTAAASHVPPPLIEQLKPGGRLVIPVGLAQSFQYLMMIEKDKNGEIISREILAVSFVPFTGDGHD